MRRTALLVGSFLLFLFSLSATLLAQEFPPSPGPPPPIAPPPPDPNQPPPEEQPQQPPAPAQPAAQPDAVPQPAAAPQPGSPQPAAPPAPGAEPPAGAGASMSVGASTEQGMAASAEADTTAGWEGLAADPEYRRLSLREQNNLFGSTGPFRLARAGSGAPGTFRFSVTSSIYSKSGFLCPPCVPPDGGSAAGSDEVERVGAHLQLSVTPIEFLEAYAGVHSYATSNSRGDPELLQVLGDTNIGLKAFMPHEPDGIFVAGGAAELILLNGTGGVGIQQAGFALSGLATLQLDNRSNVEERVPMRAHVNMSYIFDNSGSLIEDVEDQRGTRISRIERFGLDINRVDSFQIGLGVEGVWEVVRPFLEWTVDIPSNRQDYTCELNRTQAGDTCLANDTSFSGVPSRLTFGARVYPWLEGLGLLVALDLGTGATSTFWEEVAPEPTWTLHGGLGYAVDAAPIPKVERVEVERVVEAAPPPEYLLEGSVVDSKTGVGIPRATLMYDGRDLTGMVTNEQGLFRSDRLDPGTYTFMVQADGYRDGTCKAVIAPATGQAEAAAPTPPPGSMPAPGAPPAAEAPGAAAPGDGENVTQLRCELEPLPKVGSVNGKVTSADGGPVAQAQVTITDKLGRSLELTTDDAGAFRFENVPPGTVSIKASADGFLPSVTEWDIQGGEETDASISVNPKPEQPNVVVTRKEVKIKKQIHFEHNSARLQGGSIAIIQEIASVLAEHPELEAIEIQGHTDDTGTDNYNLTLSNERANTVRDTLIQLGIDQDRLTARGFGSTRPLAPNVSEFNRARNRRVQFIILRRAQ